MVKLNELTGYLNNFLQLGQIAGDPSNNGLQIEGTKEVRKIIFGVDASVALMEKAVSKSADFIFVHHGLSWGSSLKYLTKYNARLVKPLFKNDISFYAVHLPLDAHPTAGHNAQMAEMLQLKNKKMFAKYCDIEIGFSGMLPYSMAVSELASHFNNLLSSKISKYSGCKVAEEPCFVLDNGNKIKKVGIISGGSGMDGILASFRENVDCLITGEFNHQCFHLAKENGLSVIAAGHYRTETPGVFGMMEHLTEKYNVEAEFIHIPTQL